MQENAIAKFRLEYICSDAELGEAKSLGLRHELRKGKKSLLFLGCLIALMVTAVVLKIQHQVPAHLRPYTYTGAVLITIAVFFFNRDAGKKRLVTTIDIDDAGLRIQGADTHIAIPWTAVSECQESAHVFGVFLRTERVQFVLPKRAFPNQTAIEWFRQRAKQTCDATINQTTPGLSSRTTPDEIRIRFRLDFRDHLNRTFASAIIWLVGVLTILFAIGSELRDAPDMSSRGMETALRNFLKGLPFLLPVMLFVPLMMTVMSWLAQRRFAQQELAFHDDGITIIAPDGSATVPWTRYPFYKETGRYFLLWAKDRNWLMIPKRTFNSGIEQARCRALFGKHLAKSRWFIG